MNSSMRSPGEKGWAFFLLRGFPAILEYSARHPSEGYARAHSLPYHLSKCYTFCSVSQNHELGKFNFRALIWPAHFWTHGVTSAADDAAYLGGFDRDYPRVSGCCRRRSKTWVRSFSVVFVLLGGVTTVTKLENLKYVEWTHGSALECGCASHPLFFFCYFTNEEGR